MNINGITSGIEEAKAPGATGLREVDLTVSDRGVRPNKPADAHPAVDVPSQITSTPALQAELTDEEVFSLVQYFGSQSESASGQASACRRTPMTSPAETREWVLQGARSLVDWIG